MPSGLIAAVGGGLASSLIGARASSKAANAQSAAAAQQTQLQADMFNRVNKLQKQLYQQQSADINEVYDQSKGYAADERQEVRAAAKDLYDDGTARARYGARENIGSLRGALSRGQSAISDMRAANDDTLRDARSRSLDNFDPYLETGGNALAAANYNLGIGDKPDGYTGPKLSAATKYQLGAGRDQVEDGAAGAGGLYSGATLASLEKMRSGLVSADYNNQQNQLLDLASRGQSAAGSVASIEDNYADALNANRTQATQMGNALTGAYLPMITGQRDALTSNLYNIGANWSNSRAGSTSDYYDSLSGLGQNYLANMGAARANRANLYGTAATNYASGAGAAIGNAGDARAAGAIGGANALSNGLMTGLNLYGQMGGNFSNLFGGSGGTVGTGAMTAMGSLW